MNKSLSFLLIMTLFSCTDRDSLLLTEYQKSFTDAIGRKIDFEGFNIKKKSKYKVLVLLSTQCASCTLTLNRWSESVHHSIFDNKDVILLSYGPPNEYFTSNLKESTTYIKDLIHVHDTSGQFIYRNNIEIYSLDVFLLNDKNETLLIGDPTKDPLIAKFYKQF